MSTIVVGYDGSAASDAALGTAIEAATAFGDQLLIAFGYDANPVGGELTDYRDALEEHGQQLVKTALERAQGAGVAAEPVVVSEAPAPALVALAQQHDARLIVVGTRGEGPVRAALLGSTVHKLLHLADRPVLVVPLA